MKKLQRLTSAIDKLEAQVPHWEEINTAVSASSVGWHIEHTVMVTTRIIETLKASDPVDYKWKFNWARSFILMSNNIPRGKGKAPKSVLPSGEISPASLRQNIAVARIAVNELSGLQRDHHFEHPYFGKLNLSPSTRFIEMHINHHLKIIRDILKR
jgi:hypothetical protein